MQKLHKSADTRGSKLTVIPLILIACIIPFIIFYKEYNPNLSQFTWFSTNTTHIDFFLYYKQLAFLLVSFFMASHLTYYFISKKGKLTKNPLLLPLALYVVFVILSSILSEFRTFTFTGIFEQFENMFSHIGYLLIILYTITFIKTEEQTRFFIKCFIISIFVMVSIGLLQAFNLDIISSSLGQRLILPMSMWGENGQMNLTFSEVYLTLYNPNYAGMYISLVLPFTFLLAITSKKKSEKIKLLILLGLLTIVLYFTGSSAGMISLICIIPFSLFFLRHNYVPFINKYKVTFIIILLALISILITCLFLKKDRITEQIKSTATKDNYPLKEITTLDKLTINYNEESLFIDYILTNTNIDILFSDLDGNIIESTIDPTTNTFTLSDERFQDINVTPILYGDVIALKTIIGESEWLFTKSLEDNTFYIINKFNRLDKINNAPSILLRNYGNLMSGRGYIWSRSLPLLKDNLIFGTGADTFVLTYPHDDYVALQNYGFSDQIITKPHSLYLQVGIQSGLISLITLLVFFLGYLIWTMKLLYKCKIETYMEGVSLGVLLSTLSYLVISLANDSTVTVTPIFWILLGIGFVTNQMIINE